MASWADRFDWGKFVRCFPREMGLACRCVVSDTPVSLVSNSTDFWATLGDQWKRLSLFRTIGRTGWRPLPPKGGPLEFAGLVHAVHEMISFENAAPIGRIFVDATVTI